MGRVADTRVHLVRHGEVENPRGVVYGALPGFRLSERGRAQAQAAARHLRGLVRGGALLVSSPLERAQETAGIVGAALGVGEVVVEPRLTEAGAFLEGLPRRFAPLQYVGRLLDAEARARIESPRRVLVRMQAALEALAARAPGQELVVVSHQFPIWMATVGYERQHVLARRLPALFVRRPCEPASVTTLSWTEPGALDVRYWAPT